MKKIILIIAFVVSPIISYGQSIFDTLEDMDDVASVIINKDAFEILSKFKSNNDNSESSEVMEIFTMIQNLNELKVFSTSNETVANTMENMVKSEVKKSNLTELMRIKDKGSRVKIYVKTGKNKDFVGEVLMFVKDKNDDKNKHNSVIISLTGMIDINKLSKLADTVTKDKH